MLYLTKVDPNYSIKSARDPLGFQAIWQKLGRNIIEHLSTVSNNLLDFRIMTYAFHLYEGDTDSDDFINFFLRWEQAWAYTREIYGADGYNGKNFVSREVVKNPKGPFTLSNSKEHSILSNQKAYGIYGKYIRPFRDIGLHKKEEFERVMKASISQPVRDIAKKIIEYECKLKVSEINNLARQIYLDPEKEHSKKAELKELPHEEREFYTKHILSGNNSHKQSELFTLVQKYQPQEYDDYNLPRFIKQSLKSKKISEILKKYLSEIKHTEQVLSIYTTLFRYIQTRSNWSLKALCKENIVNSIHKLSNYKFDDPVTTSMRDHCLKKDKKDIINDIISRNNRVATERNNPPWMLIAGDKIDVHYQDGGYEIEEWNIDEHYENNYFLYSYFSLYEQIYKA